MAGVLHFHIYTTPPGPMQACDFTLEYAVYYFAAYRDGRQLRESDKRSIKRVIGGVDHMEPVRKELGR